MPARYSFAACAVAWAAWASRVLTCPCQPAICAARDDVVTAGVLAAAGAVLAVLVLAAGALVAVTLDVLAVWPVLAVADVFDAVDATEDLASAVICACAALIFTPSAAACTWSALARCIRVALDRKSTRLNSS